MLACERMASTMKDKADKDPEAVKLGAKGASKGGIARAEKLTPEERADIAKKGAKARWMTHGGKPVKATHDGTLRIGAAEMQCANLPDGRRVVSETAILSALGRGYSGYYSQRDAAKPEVAVPRYLSPAVLRPYIPQDLAEMIASPIAYIPKGGTGVAKGVPAEALPLICDVWIKARDAGKLTAKQAEAADAAEILRKGLQNTGIIALVDEATGYQYDRARTALADILEAFISKELARWAKTFSDDFYKELFRLRGWNVASFQKRPGGPGASQEDRSAR
jgi:P63C domain